MPWNINITSSQWSTTVAANQTINFYYREGGTTGAFTPAGTVTFSGAGAIVGTPNPFVIGGIPDSWLSAQVKAVNTCNNIDFFKNFNNPNATPCLPVGIVGNPNLPDDTVGNAYNYSFNLSGDAPFLLANINKPTWMNIAISGSSVVFSGTPNATGINVPVSFNITNCGGTHSVAFSDTLNVSSAAQPGDITMDCNVGSQDGIPFGVAGTYNFYGMGITVNTPGTVVLTAHNDQAGSLNGYSMYKQQTVNITAGQTFIDFAVDYDGGGVQTIFEMFFSVTDLSGTQLCSGSFWSFI
jgi:hypothetical protein